MKWAPAAWKAVTKTFQTRARRASRVSQARSRDLRQHGGEFPPRPPIFAQPFLPSPRPTPPFDSRSVPRPGAQACAASHLLVSGVRRLPAGPTPVAAAEAQWRRGQGLCFSYPAQPLPPPCTLRPSRLAAPPAERRLLRASAPPRPPRSRPGRAAPAPAKAGHPRLGAENAVGTLAGQSPFSRAGAGRGSRARRRPHPALSRLPCSSSFLSVPPSPAPEGSHTPRAGRCRPRGGQRGRPGGRGLRPARARSREGRGVVDLTHRAAGAAWGRRGRAARPGRVSLPVPLPTPGTSGGGVRGPRILRGLGLTPLPPGQELNLLFCSSPLQVLTGLDFKAPLENL